MRQDSSPGAAGNASAVTAASPHVYGSRPLPMIRGPRRWASGSTLRLYPVGPGGGDGDCRVATPAARRTDLVVRLDQVASAAIAGAAADRASEGHENRP